MRLLFVFLLISCKLLSQSELRLDNNFTGILSTNTNTTFGFNYVGNNSYDIKKISVDLSSNYAVRFSPKLRENEFAQRFNLGFEEQKWDAFITYQYNYSLIRKIEADHWIGVGGGIKYRYQWGKLSFSYATIYQNSNYFDTESEDIFRHSLRIKLRVDKKNISFSSEYFFQPNMVDFKDLIVFGTAKISLFTNKPFNFIIQDVVNYRSSSNVSMIHNLSLGVGYKFSKVVKKD